MLTKHPRGGGEGRRVGGGGGEEGDSHILALRVCAAGKGMVFKLFDMV